MKTLAAIIFGLLPVLSFAECNAYIDARIGSVIGGKGASGDGNWPFNGGAGVNCDLTSWLTGEGEYHHRSNGDLDNGELDYESLNIGLMAHYQLGDNILYAETAIGKMTRDGTDVAADDSLVYWFGAGVMKEFTNGFSIKFGGQLEALTEVDYDLFSLGADFRFNF